MKSFVLIGFAGCGKSTAGRLAAQNLSLPFFDSDHEIERASGCTISDIFTDKGEAAFRLLETATLRKLTEEPRCLIATGGGCITQPENIDILKRNSTVIYLRATPDKIMANIGHNTTRPLLQTEDKRGAVQRLMDERQPLYEACADVAIDITNLTRADVINRLTEEIRKRL